MKSIASSMYRGMKVIIVACCVLALSESAVAQLSDLRQSRSPLPGISATSQIGISVDMGPAQHLMTSASLIETLRPRLETLGYHVALAPTHSPDGLWLRVDCHALPEKTGSRSQQPSGNAWRFGPPCQIAYAYQQEVIPWKNVDRLIYSESVATMEQLSQSSQPLTPQECVKQFFHLYDFPVLLAAEWGMSTGCYTSSIIPIPRSPDNG